jgi:hypothetical protein
MGHKRFNQGMKRKKFLMSHFLVDSSSPLEKMQVVRKGDIIKLSFIFKLRNIKVKKLNLYNSKGYAP